MTYNILYVIFFSLFLLLLFLLLFLLLLDAARKLFFQASAKKALTKKMGKILDNLKAGFFFLIFVSSLLLL